MAKSKRRGPGEINASSMADIAFLLLIFFLVTTTIDQKKGILHQLPPKIDEPQDFPEIPARQVLEILVNSEDQILVENEYYIDDPKELRELTQKHVLNNGRLEDFSTSPQKAVVSLKTDIGTSFGMYIAVQNELIAAYREIRDEEANKLTGLTYNELKNCEDLGKKATASADEKERAKNCQFYRKQVKEKYPMRISEAEPKDLGN